MEDFVDEELDIMKEQCEADHNMSQGINIEDPIKVLNMVPAVRANQKMTLSEAVSLMNSKNSGCLIVDDDNGHAVGIFTERDLLKKVFSKDNADLKKEILKDHMTPDPECLSENDPITYALNRMSAGSYRHIPIKHDNEVKYLLSVRDIVDHIAFTYRNSVLNLPPDLRETSGQYGG